MTKTKKLTNILFYGDYDCTTGFGNVSKEIISRLSKEKSYKFVVFATNNFADKEYAVSDNVMVIPAYLNGENKKDVLYRKEFLSLLFSNPFDILICLNDLEVFSQMEKNLKELKLEKAKKNLPNFKSILYFPIDSEPKSSNFSVLSFFNEIFTYTDYAKGFISLYDEKLSKKVKVVNHGVDTNAFYPLNEAKKKEIKERMFGRSDVFVFGSVNRNSARKDISSLLLGFAQFKNTSPVDAILYLHCNPLDHFGVNLIELCNRLMLEIDKDVYFPNGFSENKGFSVERLNEVYNAFDCFITTTTAEGWGLSVTEAMATKTLVVMPKHTSLVEIGDNGNNCLSFLFGQSCVFANDGTNIRTLTNPNEVSSLMGIVYNLNEKEKIDIDAIIDRAYNHVKKYKWENVAHEFKLKIEKLK